MKVCGSCGAQMDDNLKFCGSCGAPVPDAAEAAKDAVGDMNAQAGVIPQPTNAIPTPTNTPDAGQNYGQTQQFQQGQPQQYQQPQQQYNNFQQGGAPAQPKQPNPILVKVQKNPLLAVIPLAAIIVLIVLIVVISNVTKYQKINAEDLFYIRYDGLNNYGTATAQLNAYDNWEYPLSDADLLLKSSMKDMTSDSDWEDADLGEGRKVSPYFSIDPKTLREAWTKAKDTRELVSMRQALLKTNSKGNYLIKAKLDKDKNLKNGDKIKVNVEYDKELLKENKIKLTHTSFEVEVKNLEEGVDFDPFDEKYLKVTFSGMDGEGSVSVERTSDCPMGVYYDWDWYSNLSNGDKITVTADIYLSEAGSAFYFESDGKYYIIKSKDDLKKEYEVSGLQGLTEIDVFENIEFEYERGTPFLRVSRINNDNMDKVIVDNVSLSIKGGDNLKVGDKFTVEAYCYSSLKSEGYKAKGTPNSDGYYTKEFTVDATMPAYVSAETGRAAYESETFKDSISDLETDIRSTLQGKSANSFWSSAAMNLEYKGKVEKVESMTLKDIYVSMTSKNNYSNISGYVNRIYGLYEIKVKTDDEEESSATLYAVIYFDNVVGHNGEYYQTSSWESTKRYFYGSMADFNKDVIDNEAYTVTKCAGGSSSGGNDNPPEETTTTTTTTTTAAEEEPAEEPADDSTADSAAADEE